MNSDLVFIDTETISLAPTGNAIWEVAAIFGDTAHVWHLAGLDLSQAEPKALSINGFLGRHNRMSGVWPDAKFDEHGVVYEKCSRSFFAHTFMRFTFGKTLVGANPAFDALRLSDLLLSQGACPGWHHRLIDVEAMYLGYQCGDEVVLDTPMSLSFTAELLNVEVPESDHHTALGDARVVKAVYEKMLAR